jgi:hypothetical protein
MLNKKFKPYPVEEGDEIYPNGIFHFNITKLLTNIKENSSKYYFVEVEIDSIKSSPSPNLDESTIQNADLSAPILMAEIAPGRFNVIDGNHRLEKARREGKKTILTYRLSVMEHLPYLISEDAYKAYISYWNSKF